MLFVSHIFNSSRIELRRSTDYLLACDCIKPSFLLSNTPTHKLEDTEMTQFVNVC